ncbi:RICIN domain-containing protein [Kineosporia succinea]|uniref:Ricin B lectin domain-containing protein n=1 Tax=Kineosporia succinea TaxID=84632 RepID=A0ABT9PB66_9ACTN|nr:RICIN domain-containing protein [Kineosporia succinea]MDP9829771.1 hypothetical protein [Kineosporia succinea]
MSNDEPTSSERPRKPFSWAVIGGVALVAVGVAAITATVAQTVGGKVKGEEVTFVAGPVEPPGAKATARPTTVPTASARAEKTQEAEPAKAPATRTRTVTATTPGVPVAQEPTTRETRKTTPAPVKAAIGVNYRLVNGVTGRCLGTMAESTTSTQQNCADSVRVQIARARTVNGVPVFQIKDSSGGLCLDPPGGGTPVEGDGVGATICYEPSSTDNQEWTLRNSGRVKNGLVQYFVVNTLSQLCLEVQGGVADGTDMAVGKNMQLWTCDPSDDHLWTFRKA